MLLLSQLPAPYGGLTVHTARLRDTLERHGWRVEVLSPPARHRRAGERLRRLRALASQLRFLRSIARTRCDLIHDHISSYSVGIPGSIVVAVHVAMLLSIRASGKPWVLTSGNGLLPGFVAASGGWARALHRLLYAPVRRAIAKSEPILTAFGTLGLADRSRVVGTFLAPSTAAAELSDELEEFLAAHPVAVVTAGFRFEPLYHLDEVVRAAAAARARRSTASAEIGVVVLGSAAEDAVGKPRLDAAIAETEMEKHVFVLRDVADALDVIGRCSIFVRATDVDGDANTVKEAMWMGVPVLATDLPNRPPGIEMIPVGAFDRLAEKLAKMLESSDPTQVERNRNWVREDIARNESAILALYQEALA